MESQKWLVESSRNIQKMDEGQCEGPIYDSAERGGKKQYRSRDTVRGWWGWKK